MQTDGSSAPSDDFRLRLAWDGDEADSSEEPAPPSSAPTVPSEPPAPSADDGGDLSVLRAAIEELRRDIAGLRSVVLDWPELESIASDVAALRGEVAKVREELATASARTSTPSRRPATPRQVGDPGAGQLEGELAAVREELVALRRRITLRATGEPGLGADQVERLADLLADRLRYSARD